MIYKEAPADLSLNSGPKAEPPGTPGVLVSTTAPISGEADRNLVGAARRADLADPVGILAGALGMISPAAVVLDRPAERRVAVHYYRCTRGARPGEHVVANPILNGGGHLQHHSRHTGQGGGKRLIRGVNHPTATGSGCMAPGLLRQVRHRRFDFGP